MFEKTLSDVIRGIRANRKSEVAYIAACTAEIRDELAKPSSNDVKAQAVLKLCYVLQTMSLPRFSHKRTGYLAASLSFASESDVMMLSTNTFKKDLASNRYLESSIAISCLADIVTPDLAHTLLPDLVAMLTHSKPYVRRKVLLLMFPVLKQDSNAIDIAYQRLTGRLEDDNDDVVVAAVTVICELARGNPQRYLSLAPQLFHLLTSSSNSWMLIKLIKMLASMTPFEPRLAKKLISPLTQLIETTQGMSLLYECISAVVTGGLLNPNINTNTDRLAKLCCTKLHTFLESNDPNLKYVGLTAMSKLIDTHPHLVTNNQQLLFACIDSADITIRLRALSVLSKFASIDNLQSIVDHLVTQISTDRDTEEWITNNSLSNDQRYLDTVLDSILDMCVRDRYALVKKIDWLVDVLCDLSKIKGSTIGDRLAHHLIDLAARIRELRPYCVETMLNLLDTEELLSTTSTGYDGGRGIYQAIAWILGEYCSHIEQDHSRIISMLSADRIHVLSPHLQSQCLQAVLKIIIYWTADILRKQDEIFDAHREVQLMDTIESTIKRLDKLWIDNIDLEVSGRAHLIREILLLLQPRTAFEDTKAALEDLYVSLFGTELNSVAVNAQTYVAVPSALVLDKWIVDDAQFWWNQTSKLDQLDKSSDEDEDKQTMRRISKAKKKYTKSANTASKQIPVSDSLNDNDAEERKRRQLERAARLKSDPFYIKTDNSSSSNPMQSPPSLEKVDVTESQTILLDEENTEIKNKSKRQAKLPAKVYNIHQNDEAPEGYQRDTAITLSAQTQKSDHSVVNKMTEKLAKLDVAQPVISTRSGIHDSLLENSQGVNVIVDRQRKTKVRRKEKTTKKPSSRFGNAVEIETDDVALSVFFGSHAPCKTPSFLLPVTVTVHNKSSQQISKLMFEVYTLPKHIRATGLTEQGYLFTPEYTLAAGVDVKKMFVLKAPLSQLPKLMFVPISCRFTFYGDQQNVPRTYPILCPLLPAYLCINTPPPSPEEFVTALTTSQSGNSESTFSFGHQRAVVLTQGDITSAMVKYSYSGEQSIQNSEGMINTISILMRLQLVEMTSGAGSVWGEIQLASSQLTTAENTAIDSTLLNDDKQVDVTRMNRVIIAGIIKVNAGKAVVELKASEAWILDAFVRMLKPDS